MSDNNSDDEHQDDNDFDFKNNKNNLKDGEDVKTQKIENQHMDEAVELDSENSEEIQSQEEEEQDDHAEESVEEKAIPKKAAPMASRPAMKKDDDDDDDQADGRGVNIPGAYNPADYASLDVTSEIKELFKYITRYQPETKELDSKLKPFIPDYYPAVGEVDAYIKMPRPDAKEEILGLNLLDEPSLNQSDKAGLNLLYKNLSKKTNHDSSVTTIPSIPNAEKNPKEIQKWVASVAEIRKTKQPHSVAYSKPMPDIDELMQVWPQEIEDALQTIKIPSEELDFTLQDYSKLACAILDIPVHSTPETTNIIESLHVLFTLYSEFKSNQHFQQNKNEGPQYDQMQLQLN